MNPEQFTNFMEKISDMTNMAKHLGKDIDNNKQDKKEFVESFHKFAEEQQEKHYLNDHDLATKSSKRRWRKKRQVVIQSYKQMLEKENITATEELSLEIIDPINIYATISLLDPRKTIQMKYPYRILYKDLRLEKINIEQRKKLNDYDYKAWQTDFHNFLSLTFQKSM